MQTFAWHVVFAFGLISPSQSACAPCREAERRDQDAVLAHSVERNDKTGNAASTSVDWNTDCLLHHALFTPYCVAAVATVLGTPGWSLACHQQHQLQQASSTCCAYLCNQQQQQQQQQHWQHIGTLEVNMHQGRDVTSCTGRKNYDSRGALLPLLRVSLLLLLALLLT